MFGESTKPRERAISYESTTAQERANDSESTIELERAMTTMTIDEPLIASRITKDVREAAKRLTAREARYLVDLYYIMQDQRIRAKGQARSAEADGEPHSVIDWIAAQSDALEARVRSILDAYSGANPVGEWSRRVKGIGPVIAAGLLAHIDIEKAPTVGHIWRFAGLDPTVKWEKKSKRPWNAALKVLCWKIGESFVKVSGKDDAFYGQVWADRKAIEQKRNEEYRFKDQAEEGARKVGRKTEAYKHYSQGRLPPGRIHARAKRYAVKLFLAHWHHVAYRDRYQKDPPKPYVIEHMGHAHYVPPPK